MDLFGRAIESELNNLKKGKTEKEETFNRRKHTLFLKLIGQESQIKFASPAITSTK